jgi:multiple sugar transport system permease protein
MKQITVGVSARKSGLSVGLRQWLEVFPFIAVGLLTFIVFVLFPHVKNVYIALTNYSIMPGAANPFVGLANFRRIFVDITVRGSDAYFFWIAFRNNMLAVLITVPGQLVLGLVIAVLVHNTVKGQYVYKIAFYIAVICDWVVVANIFDYIFQPDKGSLVNYILMSIGILKEPLAWLSETWTANAVIWIFCIWKGFGWVMIIYLAALTAIPHDLYEAATIDGASALGKFFFITIPSISGATYYLLVNLTIGAMNIFIQVFLLTKGGPVGRTDVMMNYIYTRAFSYFEFGYAAACGLLMGVLVFIISMALKRLMKYNESA